MKSKVFISSSCSVEDPSKDIGVFYNEITFNDMECYQNVKDLDFEGFIYRMKFDKEAKPKIRLCPKETIVDQLNLELENKVDFFLFVIPSEEMSYFKPIIDEFFKEIKLKYVIYPVSSESYPLYYMAVEANVMLKRDMKIEEIIEALDFIDGNNGIYLYSPAKDKLPGIEKYSYDDELLKITEEGSHFYIIKSEIVATSRLKVKQKTIEGYIERFKEDINDKEVLPFLIYTDIQSKYVTLFTKVLSGIFPKMKKPKLVLASPSFVLKYGINCCGVGYVVKEK